MALVARVRFKEVQSARQERYDLGSDVTVWVDYRDRITNALTAASGVAFTVTKADGSILSPAPSVVTEQAGIYKCVFTPDQAGLWAIEASSTTAGATNDRREFLMVSDTVAPAPLGPNAFTGSVLHPSRATLGSPVVLSDWIHERVPMITQWRLATDAVNDWHATCERAMAAVSAAGGGVVGIPAGAFIFDGACEPADRVTLRGLDRAASIIRKSPGSNHHLLFERFATGMTGIAFERLAFDCNKANLTGAGYSGAIYLDDATNGSSKFRCVDCDFYDFSANSHALHLKGFVGVDLSRLDFRDGGGNLLYHAIYLRRTGEVSADAITIDGVNATGIKVSNDVGDGYIKIISPVIRNVERGINISDADDVTILSPTVTDATVVGIRCGFESGASVINLQITGATIRRAKSGIISNGAGQVLISGVIEDSTETGLSIRQGVGVEVPYLQVTNNAGVLGASDVLRQVRIEDSGTPSSIHFGQIDLRCADTGGVSRTGMSIESAAVADLQIDRLTLRGGQHTTGFVSASPVVQSPTRRAGRVNLLDNAGFGVAQRGTGPFTSAASPVMTLDRWMIRRSGGAGVEVSRVAGQVTGRFAVRIQRVSGNVGTTATTFMQIMDAETLALMSAEDIAFGFAVRHGANRSVPSLTVQAARTTDAGATFNGSVWSLSNLTRTSAAITTTTSWSPRHTVGLIAETGAVQYAVGFSLDWTGTAGANDWVEIELPQLQRGLWCGEPEIVSAAEELARARRWYQALTVQTENGSRHVPLAPMRAVPSVTASVGTVSAITTQGFELSHTSATASTITASAE